MRELSSVADMQVFAQVAATGSMSSAARALGVSPGAVSKIIGRLEDRLGLRLFHRTTRQLVLTDAGNGFHARVEAILAAVDEAEDYVAGGVGRARGVLRVTAPTSFGRLHVAPHLGPFLEQHLDLSIDLQLSDAFVDIVQNGYDLAIRIAELGDSTLVARRLAPNHRLLVATPGYLAAAGTPRDAKELAEHALLNHTGEPWRLEGPDGPV
ncbi:MAG TPA: LysR family transcriptional regulator, partial [Reyranella sp.]|nr:LysR family transcriptional regulator [Reyranella sp.]